MNLLSVKLAYNNFEVIAWDDGVSILDPFHSGSRRAGDLTLKDDVHGLVGINVGWPLQILGRNCGIQKIQRTEYEEKIKYFM